MLHFQLLLAAPIYSAGGAHIFFNVLDYGRANGSRLLFQVPIAKQTGMKNQTYIHLLSLKDLIHTIQISKIM
jgi:hypothetical protein